MVELGFIDYLLLALNSLTFLGIASYYLTSGTTITKCRSIVVRIDKLQKYRISLYSAVVSVWLIGFFTFVSNSLMRIPLYALFLMTVSYMLWISLPTWVCKKKGYGGMCNCDVYKYNDFYPMIILASIAGLSYVFVELDMLQALLVMGILAVTAFAIFLLLPEKEIEPLKYDPQLLISTVDQFQAFIMNNPHERKLITMVKDTCDFCVIQVKELHKLPLDLVIDRLRIIDLSANKLDPILGFTLNIHDLKNHPVPSTRVFDHGMEVELKEGVQTTLDFQSLLI